MKILLCGDGNGGHVFCCSAIQQPDIEVHILSLYTPVREKWQLAIKEGNTLSVDCRNLDGTFSKISGNPTLITDDPAQAMDGVELIVFMNPAFTHFNYLKQLEPFIKPGMVVVALPGQTGLEYAARKLWKEKRSTVNIIAFESLPWACKLSEIGKEATILGFKETLGGGPLQMLSSKESTENAIAIVQRCIGPFPKLEVHYYTCGISLNTPNLIVHPSLMYGQWANWDGKPLKEKPRFYWDAQELGVKVATEVSEEATAVSKALKKACPEFNLKCVPLIFDFVITSYTDQIEDKTNLYTALRSHKAYGEIFHPMKETKDGLYIPDFKSRYLTEDIPFGMIPVRGMAELVAVPTPTMDKVITWAQDLIGKEFLVDGMLKGKDLNDTSCPQSCGITTVSQLFGC